MSTFARIGAIKGESRDDDHKDEIEIQSWSWGVFQSGSVATGGGGRRAGKATLHDFSFRHQVDKATPLLMKACATGEHIVDATITVRKDGEVRLEYLVITFADLLVTSVSLSAGDESERPSEDVVLAFTKVDLEYRPEGPDGTLEDGLHFRYDVRAQKVG